MMATLLLRLSAPLQSWGDESKYNIRQTRREPSKSGIIGLLAAALGLKRDSPEIAKLSGQLRMGVRIDQPGQVIRDYHTARPPKYTAKGEVRHHPDGSVMMADAPEVTERYYLCDACFLVGMESSDETLLNRLAEALSSPCFPLYLGRRACPPTLPLLLGIRSVPLADALREEPWQASTWVRRHAPTRLRIILENAPGEAPIHTLRDAPISFSPIHRRYTQRGLEREQMVELIENAHDPMAELY